MAARSDFRVSAARADAGAPLSLLCTFVAELHNTRHVAWQGMIAVLLPREQAAAEHTDPAEWLRFAGRDRAIAATDPWRRFFATWAPARQAEAESVARATMQRLSANFIATQSAGEHRAAAGLRRWLSLRADEICGVRLAQTQDLFGTPPAGPRWRSLHDPLDRLAAFAVDPDNTPGRRREANTVVALFGRRAKESAEQIAFAPPALRPVGLLMLVPPELAA